MLENTEDKSKTDTNTLQNNFRGIAISPIISKVFEHCFLRRFQSLLATSSNQFGFKQGLACNNAVYSFRKVVDSYVDSGTTSVP